MRCMEDSGRSGERVLEPPERGPHDQLNQHDFDVGGFHDSALLRSDNRAAAAARRLRRSASQALSRASVSPAAAAERATVSGAGPPQVERTETKCRGLGTSRRRSSVYRSGVPTTAAEASASTADSGCSGAPSVAAIIRVVIACALL